MESPVKPYNKAGKKQEVEEMFDNIAHRYDLLNRLFSLRIDTRWRKKALRLIRSRNPESLLDVATGTGDFALSAAKLIPTLIRIIGVDISEGMLVRGRSKVDAASLNHKIQLQKADSENLPLESDSFDAVTVAFGVRNFENLEKGISEMWRVLKPNAPLVVLEFSRPTRFPIKQLFGFYFKRVMPTIGRIMSKDHRAYTYLPESVDQFPSGQQFLNILQTAGFNELKCVPLSGGIASIYIGIK